MDRDRIQKKYSITVEEWEKMEGVKLEDGLYRGLMGRDAGDELAAGCAEPDVPLSLTSSIVIQFNESNTLKGHFLIF